jgi:hypothetical protein
MIIKKRLMMKVIIMKNNEHNEAQNDDDYKTATRKMANFNVSGDVGIDNFRNIFFSNILKFPKF